MVKICWSKTCHCSTIHIPLFIQDHTPNRRGTRKMSAKNCPLPLLSVSNNFSSSEREKLPYRGSVYKQSQPDSLSWESELVNSERKQSFSGWRKEKQKVKNKQSLERNWAVPVVNPVTQKVVPLLVDLKPKSGRRKNLLLAASKENTGDLSQSSVCPKSKTGEVLS